MRYRLNWQLVVQCKSSIVSYCGREGVTWSREPWGQRQWQ